MAMTAMTWSPPQKHGGTTRMTGVLSWMATDSLRKTRPTRRGGGVALYVREQLECIELGLAANEEQVESLWVRIKGDITVGVYYRPT